MRREPTPSPPFSLMPAMAELTEKAGMRMPSPITRPVAMIASTSRLRCANLLRRNTLQAKTGHSVRGPGNATAS